MRNELNQHAVEFLYIKKDGRSKTGFSCQYRDPRYGMKEFGETKQYRSLGSDINTAIFTAKRLNAMILPKIVDNRLLDIFETPALSTKSLLLSKWLVTYTNIQLKKIEVGNLKPNTWRTRKNIIKAITNVHGLMRLNSITTKTIKSFLDSYVSQDKNRMAQAIRSVYCDIFAEAAGAGEVESNFNPAKIVKNPVAKVNKSRLSSAQFNLIVKHQKYLSHKCAYLLALVTAQRRTDLCLLRKCKGDDWDSKMTAYRLNPNHFIDAKSDYGSFAGLVEHAPYSYIENNALHIFQLKTGKMIKIPLSLKIESLDLDIKQVVEMANVNKESKFVLHHKTARAKNEVGDPLHPDTVSRSFKRAREDAQIKWQGSPATYHEIRSLAERLYREQGIDTKALCGHSEQRMTDRYNDLRGSGWLEVKIEY